MVISRLIFRVDYQANYDIIDAPGQVMKILDGGPKDFWSELRESVQSRSVIALNRSADQDAVWQMTVNPTSIVGTVESASGISTSRILGDEKFSEILRMVDSLCEHFRIMTLQRAGFRLFYISKLEGSRSSIVSAFRNMYSHDLIAAFQKEAGEITDAAIVLNGKHEDSIEYHYRMGPFVDENANEWAPGIKDAFLAHANDQGYNIILDIDLYETGVTIHAKQLSKWIQPLPARANSVICKSEELIKNNIRKSQ